jgi:hypothetical protein
MLKIAFSLCANNTLISVIQDDAQDTGDHVDRQLHLSSGRLGAKCGGLHSYNTVNMVQTIEEVLGLIPNSVEMMPTLATQNGISLSNARRRLHFVIQRCGCMTKNGSRSLIVLD